MSASDAASSVTGDWAVGIGMEGVEEVRRSSSAKLKSLKLAVSLFSVFVSVLVSVLLSGMLFVSVLSVVTVSVSLLLPVLLRDFVVVGCKTGKFEFKYDSWLSLSLAGGVTFHEISLVSDGGFFAGEGGVALTGEVDNGPPLIGDVESEIFITGGADLTGDVGCGWSCGRVGDGWWGINKPVRS